MSSPLEEKKTDLHDALAVGPRHVTLDLIRKRSEHNESLVSNLEEIALHQEELEAIGPVLGRACGKTLRILLLQNNVIGRMDNSELRPMRSLEYLNLALNNVSVIEGVSHCEFLHKLDLTLNFIDVDALEESIDNLRHNRSLRELYLMGNPCAACDDGGALKAGPSADYVVPADKAQKRPAGWAGCRMYVVARLPQLRVLDGKEISRSERIVAMQRLPSLSEELTGLAEDCRAGKDLKRRSKMISGIDSSSTGEGTATNRQGEDGKQLTGHSPEVRAEISREMAQQKAEKEARERANAPKRRGEKEFDEEQRKAIEAARNREERGEIRQCNEGKWNFRFDEEKKPGFVLLDVPVQKHLSSTLIDVDVHPSYISLVIKSKVLRLVLPAEVKAEESTAQRSATTGHLLVSMPKVDPEENMISVRAVRRAREREAADAAAAAASADRKTRAGKKKNGLGMDMMKEAAEQLRGSVRIDGLVEPRLGGVRREERPRCDMGMKEVATQRNRESARLAEANPESGDEDAPPPMF